MQRTLSGITGVAPRCFRAPAGLRNPSLDPLLHRSGLPLVSWTRWGDTCQRGPEKVLSALRDKLAAHTRSGEPVILAVLPALLAEIRARSQYRHAAAAERL